MLITTSEVFTVRSISEKSLFYFGNMLASFYSYFTVFERICICR